MAHEASRGAAQANDDPPPTPPERPDPGDCCHSGCDPCVFDLYDAALDRYHAARAAWEARQASRTQMTRKTRKLR